MNERSNQCHLNKCPKCPKCPNLQEMQIKCPKNQCKIWHRFSAGTLGPITVPPECGKMLSAPPPSSGPPFFSIAATAKNNGCLVAVRQQILSNLCVRLCIPQSHISKIAASSRSVVCVRAKIMNTRLTAWLSVYLYRRFHSSCSQQTLTQT